MMRKFTKKRDIVQPGVTRFPSAFLTLQSLKDKKDELRQMFSSIEWEECRFSNTVKGKAAFVTVLSNGFWTGVSLCLKLFNLLVKVLRMVDADWKPSMGFVYGELVKAKEEIKGALGDTNGPNGDEEVEVQPDSEAHWQAVGDAMEADEYLQPRQSSRTATKPTQRQLFYDDFESGSEQEVVYEEGEYESDGDYIRENCRDEE
ncbi:hypothetical protein CTI12_AA088310 [Artemisia annua]|uniref:Uncharacterized protein n=1 Tax=Artemisia annua TaxID=35608 RepID=A0A2U1Q1G2_ARTAN|nr:hypothetical protein CTI12_AA088310 [Artemisia annua]